MTLLVSNLGGWSPALKLLGRNTAWPAAPPVHPSIGQSHSIPSDLTPPTTAFSTGSSIVGTLAPTIATTTTFPCSQCLALVTMVTSLPLLPTSTFSFVNLSFLGTGSASLMTPTTMSFSSSASSSNSSPHSLQKLPSRSKSVDWHSWSLQVTISLVEVNQA